MKKSMKKVIPVVAVTLGMMAGGTSAFADPNPLANDLPAQAETPEVQSPMDEASQEEKVSQDEKAQTPVEKPKPEPSVKQSEVSLQPELDEKPKPEPKQESKEQRLGSEKVVAQRESSSSTTQIEGGTSKSNAHHAPVKSEDKQVVVSNTKQKKEKVVSDSGTDDTMTEEEAERISKTEDGGEMPKTAAPGPLAALVGAGLMAGGAVVKRFRFRRG